MTAPTIIVLGTCDTKLQELLYVRDQLVEKHGMDVKFVDVGRTPSTHPAVSVTQTDILKASNLSQEKLVSLPRGEFIAKLISCTIPFIQNLISTCSIHGMISLGGSGGSSLAASVMRGALPLGFPKLIVSTMASGDVRPYVSESDVTMMYSVVDIAGLNDILIPILDNAAGAIVGMTRAYHTRLTTLGKSLSLNNKRIAITMFGVTTPAVTHARAILSAYPCTTYVFHATGSGGLAMERLIASGFFDGVLDLTTTELADELVGGMLSAGPNRLTAATQVGIPQIVSLGALDMVNFGPVDTVPEQFRSRNLLEHNPSVTIMRTSIEECNELGKQIAKKLTNAKDSRLTEVWVPKRGLSVLSVEGAPFYDSVADAALFDALRKGLTLDDGVKSIALVEDERDINNELFVEGMVDRLVDLMGMSKNPSQS